MRLEEEGRGGLRRERAPDILDGLSTTLDSLEQSESFILKEEPRDLDYPDCEILKSLSHETGSRGSETEQRGLKGSH
jgi:hypothetical protein